jgi:hypothetical protein
VSVVVGQDLLRSHLSELRPRWGRILKFHLWLVIAARIDCVGTVADKWGWRSLLALPGNTLAVIMDRFMCHNSSRSPDWGGLGK